MKDTNVSQQFPLAPIKRGRGRPKLIWIGKKPNGVPLDMHQFRRTFAPMPDISDDELVEELRKIMKNTSFRLNLKNGKELGIAKWLIYFEHAGIPKAALIKECLLEFMNVIFAKKLAHLGVAGHFFSAPSSGPPLPAASPPSSS